MSLRGSRSLAILRMFRIAIAVLILAVAVAGGCTTPPDNGYNLAGRNQTLPGFAGDGATLGSDGTSGILSGFCAPAGVYCHNDFDCCIHPDGGGGACEGFTSTSRGFCSINASPSVVTAHGTCAPDGITCVTHSDCCDDYCSNGVCGALEMGACVPDGIKCHRTTDCCNNCDQDGAKPGACNNCTAGQCTAPNPLTNPTGPLCVPTGIFCSPDHSQDCCGYPNVQCIENESFQFVCIVPSP
jgi:hypothetical protein